MHKILHLAIDVQQGTYGHHRGTHEDNQYTGAIADRIRELSTDPNMITLWAMMAAPRSIPIKHGDPALLPFWKKSVLQSARDKIDCAQEHQLYCTPESANFIMNKPDGSAFGNSLLAPFIEENNFLDIAITGSFIGGCVAATLEDARALFPNLKSAMLIDHCGAYSARSHADAFGRSQELLEQQGIKTPYMTKNGFWEALDYVSEPKRCDMRIVHSLATSPIT